VRSDTGNQAEALFAFEHVSVAGADGRWRLHDASGSVPPSGVTVLVGPSGSGKSTLLRSCNRLEAPVAGTVRFRGSDVATLDVLRLRRQVAMVFQRPTPFPGTGRDNLRVADPTLDDERGRGLLDRVQLGPDFLDRNAMQLSAGEAQRLCLARSLAVDPEVVLMDEVTSSVDPGARRALEGLARSLADHGTPIVWVTHDLSQAHRLADSLVVVIDGRIAHGVEAAAFVEVDPRDQ
jgi:putative ABC transport system ATP-binding protein